jgi:CheY-like chemotaxis protein
VPIYPSFTKRGGCGFAGRLSYQIPSQVILMDVGMPRLNGLDATRLIRERPWGRSATIIALTGWGQEGDKQRSRQAGCDGHLVKPVTLADLQKLLIDSAGDSPHEPAGRGTL